LEFFICCCSSLKDGTDNQHTSDSTTNTNTGTKTAAGNPTQVDAKIGKGQTTAVDKLINIGQDTSIAFGTGEFAVFQWVKKDTSLDNYQTVGNLQNSGNFDGYRMLGLSSTGYLRGEIRTGGTGYDADSTVNIQDNAWHRIVLVRRSTGIYIYEAVSQVGSNTNGNTQNTVDNSADTVIGDGRSGVANAGDGAGWPGDVDESYFWKGTAPTAGWILADYNNQSSPNTFYSVGSQESQGVSPSASVSPSSSVSPSVSPSASKSPSSSVSPSVSPSSSVSASISPSPSTGYEGYSRGEYGALPTNDDDLSTLYNTQEYEDVSETDSVYVEQEGTLMYMLHEFKNFISDVPYCTVEWEGKTDLDLSASTCYLQVYNHDSDEWETVDSKNSGSVDTNFILTADIADTTDYKDTRNVITCRVYQLAI